MTGCKRFSAFAALLVAATLALFAAQGTAWGANSESVGLAASSTIAKASSETQTVNAKVLYKAYVGAKWTGWKKGDTVVGSTSKKFQMIRLKPSKSGLTGKVQYRIYQRNKGWSKWVANGKVLGQKGWYMRGIQVKLTGQLAKQYDVVYRVYLDGLGWQPWTMNGGIAGSKGKLGSIQKIKVKFVRKCSTVGLADGAYYLTAVRNLNSTAQLPGSKTKANVQITKATFSASGTNLRFYLRNLSDGTVAIQSCASGLYLCDVDGAVLQRPDGGTAQFRWKLSTWNGGYVLANALTGKRMKFSSGKLATGSKGGRFAFTRTDVLADGTYAFASVAKGNLLAVEDESDENGAQLQVQGEEKTNAEVFKLVRTATDTYRISNVGSAKRIEVDEGSTAENTSVRQNSANSGNLQKWKAALQTDGTYAFLNKASGKVLSVAGSGASGSYVRSSADTGAKTQRWKLVAHKAYPQAPEKLAVARASAITDKTSSNTNYLITVDLTHHWMCIFKGSKGNRSLFKSWICSTGAPGSGTPTGDYIINGNTQYEFGDGYSCYYATGFIDWVYLFHSVKYYKNTKTILDGRLGESVSEGCVRLEIENAKWLYDSVNAGTIPYGTKVKIYY